MAGRSPSGFSDKSAEFMVSSIMASRPGPEAAKHYHHAEPDFTKCDMFPGQHLC